MALCKYRKLKSAVGDNKERIKGEQCKTSYTASDNKQRDTQQVTFVGATNVFIVYYQTGKSVMVDVRI